MLLQVEFATSSFCDYAWRETENTTSFNEVCENTAWIIFRARYFIEGRKRLDVVYISLFKMQFVMSDDRKTPFFNTLTNAFVTDQQFEMKFRFTLKMTN
jgi:hypothetical protein